jgi:predicted ATPase/transcriptional regulator with XRE-family HTH domain
MDGALAFGHRVRQRRKELDLTQAVLAQRVGCAKITIQKIESGQRRPSREIAELLALHLRLPPDEREMFVCRARGVAFAEEDPDSFPAPARARLPTPLTPLVGRAEAVLDVCNVLLRDDVQLLSLVGPPGIGKSRLALQVASELQSKFADGAQFVPLAPLSDVRLVTATIAQVLELREQPGQSLLDALKAFLSAKQMLLLLDNFEHILDAALIVPDLLMAAPGLKILLTSREILGVYGEYRFPVPPLDVPDLEPLPPLEAVAEYSAVLLFCQRAQAVQPAFRLTGENAAAVARLCERLDGLPLAIELAASQTRFITPETIGTSLDSRLAWAARGPRDAPARQQTLRAAIEWSNDLLDEAEQRLFRRLGIFSGGFTLRAVEAICNPEGDLGIDPWEGVASLLDTSLLQPLPAGEKEGEPRYGMLETIREYARDQLEASGEAARVQRGHLAFYYQMVEQTMAPGARLWSAAQLLHIDEIAADYDNLRVALGWALEGNTVEEGARLACTLFTFWWVRGYWSEARDWFLRAAETGAALSLEWRALVINAAAWYAHFLGEFEQAQALAEETKHLSLRLEDPWGLAFTANLLGWTAGDRQEHALAEQLLEEGLDLARESADPWIPQVLLISRGIQAVNQAEYEQAQSCYEEASRLARENDDIAMYALALENLGHTAHICGNLVHAKAYLESSLRLFEHLGDRYGTAGALVGLGAVACQEHQYDAAAAFLREGLALYWQLGCRAMLGGPLSLLTDVAMAQEQWERAARLMGATDALDTDLGYVRIPEEHQKWEHKRMALRNRLGSATFGATWDDGHEMPLEQVVRYALDEAGEYEQAAPDGPAQGERNKPPSQFLSQ